MTGGGGVLMVAEKPSLAESIAKILSGNQCHSRRSNISKAVSVHEWTGSFLAHRSIRLKMTAVCGHVNTIDFPPKFNNWDKTDPETLFKAPCVKKEANENLRIPAHLAAEARGCDFLVLWLDCDKEGENICFEVIEAVERSMNLKRKDQSIYRAKFSAITATDINKAFKNLGVPNYNESMSVEARMELDLRIGCAFTRYQTKFFQGKYGDLDSNLISFGPCQTPTLGFCVERHDQIQSFKPETYYSLDVKTETLRLKWNRVRCFDRDVLAVFHDDIKKEKFGKVISVDEKECKKSRPLPLNTVEMLRVASSGLNMSPHQTMAVAERLYTQGYISYPRTETTTYPANFDIKDALRMFQNKVPYSEYVQPLLNGALTKAKKGSDAGDHPPITPTALLGGSDLAGESGRLYDFIVRNFIATVSPDCVYTQTTVTVAVGSEKFACVGKQVIEPGFTSVLSWMGINDEEMLSPVKVGQQIEVRDIAITEHRTSAPDYLTESDLISLMEKHSIGTDASIPVHIKNICDRNYVTVTATGRRLVPTSLGIVLVHGYQKVDYELVSPVMRSAMEQQLNKIANGEANFDAVLQHFIEIYRRKFVYFVTTIGLVDQLFECSFTTLAQSGRPHSRCGKCNRYLKLIDARPIRLHCGTCNDTYSVPQAGTVRIHRELRCPLDNFELCYFFSSTDYYAFCPFCYNQAPFEDMGKNSGCNNCTHPTCENGLFANMWVACSSCPEGTLVLDPALGPKWKFCCNSCGLYVKLFKDADKLRMLDSHCEQCEARLFKVSYKEGKSPFGDSLTREGCGFCDEQLRSLIDLPSIASQAPRGRGGGRGRGGRGDRGRGRGRGPRR